MNKCMVDLVNNLSEIYASIRKRVVDSGEMLESDTIFLKFYNNFINEVFDVDKRRKMLNE